MVAANQMWEESRFDRVPAYMSIRDLYDVSVLTDEYPPIVHSCQWALMPPSLSILSQR